MIESMIGAAVGIIVGAIAVFPRPVLDPRVAIPMQLFGMLFGAIGGGIVGAVFNNNTMLKSVMLSVLITISLHILLWGGPGFILENIIGEIAALCFLTLLSSVLLKILSSQT
jgi:hypothetical protein